MYRTYETEPFLQYAPFLEFETSHCSMPFIMPNFGEKYHHSPFREQNYVRAANKTRKKFEVQTR